MTTVDNSGGLGGEVRIGGARRRQGGGGTGRRLWQVPLLLAGLAAFGFGVRSLVRSIRPVPFETQVQDIRGLLSAGKNVAAIDQVNAIGNYYMAPEQQAQLQWLAGDAHYLAQMGGEHEEGELPEAPATGGAKVNFERVLDHYRKAVAYGALPTAKMNERWGLAALALRNWALGIEKLEAAAGQDGDLLVEQSHHLVAAYLATGNIRKAEEVVERVLASDSKHLDVDQRAWGYAKRIELALMGRHAGAAAHDESLEKAMAAARQAAIGMPERDPAGRVLLWIGRAEFEEGKLDLAKEHLEAARGKFLVHHLDDGRAAVLLGRIALAQGQLELAGKLFQEVVLGHAGTPVFAAARLGRAEVLAMKGEAGEPDGAMEMDYRFVLSELAEKQDEDIHSAGRNELVNVAQVRSSLEMQYQRYVGMKRLREGLIFLEMLEELKDKPTPERVLAWAVTREGRARQLAKQEAEGGKQDEDAEHGTRNTKPAEGSSQALLKLAAEDYLAHSKLTTMNDAVSGASLWKAAQLFDEAGETLRSIEVYDRFVRERPRDAKVPEGMLAIGRLYQSVGMFDKAIAAYRRNMEKNPTTPAAYTSAVNLARCYMMLGAAGEGAEKNFEGAEKALLSLVQDNQDILPTANEYRVSLFTLGELYYRNRRWADAILRLEEAVERYPDDAGVPRALFMLAETYRKSALEIEEAMKSDNLAHPQREAFAKARGERFERAMALFGKVIAALDPDFERSEEPGVGGVGGRRELTALEQEILRTSYMDRAGCAFALGDFPGAVKLYDMAATRFSQDVTAVEAYVQIVNAYQAMKQPVQASAAAERARWVLKRIPDEAFGKGTVKLSREYYEGLLAMSKGT